LLIASWGLCFAVDRERAKLSGGVELKTPLDRAWPGAYPPKTSLHYFR